MEEILDLLTLTGKIHGKDYERGELETLYMIAQSLKLILAGKLAMPDAQLAMKCKRQAVRLLDTVNEVLEAQVIND